MKEYDEISEGIKDNIYLRAFWEVHLSENKYIKNLTFNKVVDW